MPRTVVVVGAGISGLAAALHLTRAAAAPKVFLLEASDRTGGWLQTTRTEDGAIFEHGPRGVRPAGAMGKNTLQLVSELALDTDVIPVTYSNNASKNRYLFVGGQLCKLPSNIRSTFYRLPPFSQPLAYSLAREPFVTRGKETDESVHHFCTRRFGEEMAIYAVDSLCRGVFAGDSRKLSARSCFPAQFQAERSFGSVILGMLAGVGVTKWDGEHTGLMDRAQREGWTQWTLKGGMQTLPEAMEATLRKRGVEIHLHTPVTHLQPTEDGACQVLMDGGSLTADHVFSSVPARVLSSLLPPVWQPLAKTLKAIGSVSVAVVNMEYEGLVLPVSGFGHLVPSGECSEILGVVYDSCSFPQQDQSGSQTTRLTDCIPQYEIGHWKLLGLISLQPCLRYPNNIIVTHSHLGFKLMALFLTLRAFRYRIFNPFLLSLFESLPIVLNPAPRTPIGLCAPRILLSFLNLLILSTHLTPCRIFVGGDKNYKSEKTSWESSIGFQIAKMWR
ncbi:protoporphyrinogen oxidase isoform X3 [Hypanus sabinus]|uniref:protoporphyrinogen oxidase isoform X3 n=1 Tax=Hypanus sabinus TaxID=79690 RepID=UPI0028C462BB|nr:protoporphyrinogen oxidase isoform X3 [Hypanus sabinus]